MAVLASPDGLSFPHSTFYDFPFRHSSRYATLNMATSPSTVNRYHASCLLDPQSPVPTVSPFFSLQLNIRCQKFGIPVAVVTTTGVFLCLIEIQLGAADNVYDVRLGRDWFSYCTTTVPHAQIFLSDDMCLMCSSSPLLAMRPIWMLVKIHIPLIVHHRPPLRRAVILIEYASKPILRNVTTYSFLCNQS